MTKPEAVRTALLERGDRVARVLIDFAPDIIYQVDEKGLIEFVSPSVRSLGWEPEDLLGEGIYALLDASCEEDAAMARLTERRVGERATRNLRLRFKSREGSKCDFDVNDMMFSLSARGIWDVPDAQIKEADKRFLGTLGIARDVSAQVRAENELRAAYADVQRQVDERTAELLATNASLQNSHHKLKILFDSAADAVVIHGLDGKFLDVNKTAVDRLGYSRTELLNMSPVDIDAEHSSGLYVKRIRQALKNEGIIFEASHVTKRGHVFPVECNSRLCEYDGKPAVLTIARDISQRKAIEAERKQLEQSLYHAQKLDVVGEAAGCIAHDINNRLTVISGYVEMLQSTQGLAPEMLGNLNEISKAAAGAATLNRQLLVFARKEEGCPVTLDVAQRIGSLKAFMRGLLPENIELVTPGDVTGMTVFADPGQLEQVIINLVANARDALAPGGGSVVIAVERIPGDGLPDSAISHEVVRISVSDNGPGVAPELRERIFDPFFTTKASGKGTGLGLSVVYGITRQHGGCVDVVDNEGGGAMFRVQLPYHEQADQIQTGTECALPRAAGAGARILIVEDEELLLNFSTKALENGGYEVHPAQTGTEALTFLKEGKNRPDLIFMDVMLPDIKSDEMIRQVRELAPGIPIIFTSGYAPDEAEVVRKISDEERFIQKPYDMNALLSLAEEALAGALSGQRG